MPFVVASSKSDKSKLIHSSVSLVICENICIPQLLFKRIFEKWNKAFFFYSFRLTLLQDTHRSHQREYEKYLQDVESSKSTIQNLESSSNQNLNYKFYKSMKIYVENLIGCLNEKVCVSSFILFSGRNLWHQLQNRIKGKFEFGH